MNGHISFSIYSEPDRLLTYQSRRYDLEEATFEYQSLVNNF